jgi:hypothetical protein
MYLSTVNTIFLTPRCEIRVTGVPFQKNWTVFKTGIQCSWILLNVWHSQIPKVYLSVCSELLEVSLPYMLSFMIPRECGLDLTATLKCPNALPQSHLKEISKSRLVCLASMHRSRLHSGLEIVIVVIAIVIKTLHECKFANAPDMHSESYCVTCLPPAYIVPWWNSSNFIIIAVFLCSHLICTSCSSIYLCWVDERLPGSETDSDPPMWRRLLYRWVSQTDWWCAYIPCGSRKDKLIERLPHGTSTQKSR